MRRMTQAAIHDSISHNHRVKKTIMMVFERNAIGDM